MELVKKVSDEFKGLFFPGYKEEVNSPTDRKPLTSEELMKFDAVFYSAVNWPRSLRMFKRLYSTCGRILHERGELDGSLIPNRRLFYQDFEGSDEEKGNYLHLFHHAALFGDALLVDRAQDGEFDKLLLQRRTNFFGELVPYSVREQSSHQTEWKIHLL